MQENLHLSNEFLIPAKDFANQANAILGIKKAGKSYTAMLAAEQLMDCNIPIIAFDPIGIWKYLKVGVGKHKGYPVVVAGGKGSDIILNTDNVKDIVRAAMNENVSLVIDLYSRELSNKSTWRKIVHDAAKLVVKRKELFDEVL